MKNMGKWMLGAAVAAGALGLGATQANAAEFGIYARGPVAYVPPCPGPGYEWVAGYYANGYWVPGRWAFRGVRAVGPAPVVGFGYRGHDRDRFYDRDRDRDRFRERDRDRFRDRDGYRERR
jgi:hypothetical protein